MTVLLPASPRARKAKPRFLDFGNVTEPSLGGVDQRLTRLGSRWQVDYELPPMKADEAKVWIARLIRGKHEKARMYFPQPGATGANVGLGHYATNTDPVLANSYTLPLSASAGTPTYPEGNFITILNWNNGVSYLHQVTAGIAGAEGTISVMPAFRSALPAGCAAYVDAYIEGYVQGGEWDIDEAKVYGLSFSIREAA